MSSISFLPPHASLLSYASPNSTKLRTSPWKPYLLPNPIHGGISSSSAATMSHDSLQNPLADARDLDSGYYEFDPYTFLCPHPDAVRKLLRERMVFLMGKIDAAVADMIIFQLMMLDFEDPTRDIKLFINSSGGLLSATAAICDVVKFVRADVSTIALGTVASTPSMILCGGTKGKRLAMPRARILRRKKDVKKFQSTASTFKRVQEDIYSDRYMSPREAVRRGLIDGIIGRDYMASLMHEAEKVEPKVSDEEINKDPREFLTPLFPRNN